MQAMGWIIKDLWFESWQAENSSSLKCPAALMPTPTIHGY